MSRVYQDHNLGSDLNFQYGDTPTVRPRFASSFLGSLAIWWADTAATLLPMQALLCNATFRWTGRVTLFVIIFRSFWPEGRSGTLSQYTVISQNVKPRLRYPAYKLPLDEGASSRNLVFIFCLNNVQYKVGLVAADLGCVDFDLDVPL